MLTSIKTIIKNNQNKIQYNNKNKINRNFETESFKHQEQEEQQPKKFSIDNCPKNLQQQYFEYFDTNDSDNDSVYDDNDNISWKDIDIDNDDDDDDNYDDNIEWTSQQYLLNRPKRDDFPIYFTNEKDFLTDYDEKDIKSYQSDTKSSSSSPPSISLLSLSPSLLDLVLSSLMSTVIVTNNKNQQHNQQQEQWKDDKRYNQQKQQQQQRDKRPFNDELWDQQWYLHGTSSKIESVQHKEPSIKMIKENSNLKLNLNVQPVYEMGLTGKGIRVAVLDDGIEYDHDDLIKNFDPEISWDCNNNNPNPHPLNSNSKNKIKTKEYRKIIKDENKKNYHGTRCAGEIAMTANNKKCGIGVAFNARIGGIKLLDGHVYDLIEGIALSFAHNKIDIYSSSWGPTDDGITLERPGKFATEAIKRGIKYGRNGLGSIYVWASGNGGGNNDNCNADGYVNSIYTIAVGSITKNGDIPWYSESCTALMTVTFSAPSMVPENKLNKMNNIDKKNMDQMITTTDLGNSCTLKHTGTSASAPLAAGIIALGLEANTNLTWRDIQHIIVRSSEYKILLHHKNWLKNSAGYFFNSNFGFGLMNAERFVKLAIEWRTPLPEQITENLQGYFIEKNDVILTLNTKSKNVFELKSTVKIYFDYSDIEEKSKASISRTRKNNTKILFLEHIELTFTILGKCCSTLEGYLKSPTGTQIKILQSRSKDCIIRNNKNKSYINWTVMSVATWSENPIGKWILYIKNSNRNQMGFENFKFGKFTLTLYGTKIPPQ